MVDVTVMGAGAFGLAVAWACAAKGAKVRVVDPGGVGAGSSGGLVGALAPHTPENWNDKKEFQFQSLIMAKEFWADVEATGGVSPGYARTGRLQPVMNDRGLELAQARSETAKDLWRGKALWQVISADEAGEWVPVTPTGYLIQDTLTARMSPRGAGAALTAAVLARGGEIVHEGAAEGKIVWATGWQGLLDLSQEMGRMVGNGVKGQSALLQLDRADLPQLFADTVHVVPHADGTVAIGSTSEREFDDPTSTDAQLDAVLERAYAVVPVLKDAKVIERWAGVRPRAKSRAPMLGDHPTRDGEFIANGGFKIGFGMAPKVGQVMAELLLDGVDGIPEDFKPGASL
ncbi:Glycine/D-amino acid oxidase [Shimia gijangensis]|uniref:Glycine/D-amino acid oxidase n=1 Tax=Shimia gijangensis TaxID=1470563 RepID=A0A1M6AZB7_9RHOB|nr:FAD-binding oxidoreductase [Shimia gijangensis]SHI41825.1 Glycine/D-amino acid oxidase [Shimia gijangensis]